MKKNIIANSFFLICCTIYCLSAAFLNAFGIASPEMQSYLHTSQTQQGLILTFQSIGSVLAAIYLAFHGERFNKIRTMAVGIFSLSLGALLVGLLPLFFSKTSTPGITYYLLFLSLFFASIGYVTIDLTMNSMIADIYNHTKETRIPILHTFYGLGAMFVPILFSVKLFHNCHLPTYASSYLFLGIIGLFLFIIYYCFMGHIIPSSPYSDMTELRARVTEDPYEVFRTAKAWQLLLIAFLYTAFQIGLSSWLSSYQIQQLQLSAAHSQFLISAYFSGSLLMRLLSPTLFRKKSIFTFYSFTGMLTSLSLAAAFLSGYSSLYPVFLICGGFLQGGMVPAFMIIVSNIFPKRQSSSAAIFVIAVSLAGLFIPILMGGIIEYFSYRTAMIFIIICLFSSSVLMKFTIKSKNNVL